MSMNLNIVAIEGLYTDTGELRLIRTPLEVVQTPTKITREILSKASQNEMLDAYCDFVMDSYCYDKEYAGEVVTGIREEISELVENGFKIEFSEI